MDAKRLGADAILYHNIYDHQDEASFAMEEWDDLRGNTNLPIYITSNIDRNNITVIESSAEKPRVSVRGSKNEYTEILQVYRIHSYDVGEIVCTTIVGADSPYTYCKTKSQVT